MNWDQSETDDKTTDFVLLYYFDILLICPSYLCLLSFVCVRLLPPPMAVVHKGCVRWSSRPNAMHGVGVCIDHTHLCMLSALTFVCLRSFAPTSYGYSPQGVCSMVDQA